MMNQRLGQQSCASGDLESSSDGTYFWTVQARPTGSHAVSKTTWSLVFLGFHVAKRRILVKGLSWRFACAEPRRRSPTNEHPHSSPFFALRFQAASASGLSLDRTPLSVFAPLHPTAADSLPPWTSLAPFSPPPRQSWAIPATEDSRFPSIRSPAAPTWTDRRRGDAARHDQGRPTWILIQEPLSATRPSSPQVPPPPPAVSHTRWGHPLLPWSPSCWCLFSLPLLVPSSWRPFSTFPSSGSLPDHDPRDHPECCHFWFPATCCLPFLLLFFRSRLTLGRVVDLDVDCSLIFFCSPSTFCLRPVSKIILYHTLDRQRPSVPATDIYITRRNEGRDRPKGVCGGGPQKETGKTGYFGTGTGTGTDTGIDSIESRSGWWQEY